MKQKNKTYDSKMLRFFSATGKMLSESCVAAGDFVLTFIKACSFIKYFWHSKKTITKQLDLAGFGSLLVLSLITGLTGMILVVQMGYELQYYGALERLGAIIGKTFCREMGPLWVAVIVLARVGSSMAAEIGTMMVNEEVEALRVMSINPIRYLVFPRLIALIIAMPFLTAIADIVGLAGGALVAKSMYSLPYESFYSSAQKFLYQSEFFFGLFKSVVFAMIIATIACGCGLKTSGGAEGVGKTTTKSVVLNVVFVLIANFIMTGLYSILSRAGYI